MLNQQVDILIVGGGLVGSTLMLSLVKAQYNILMIEANAASSIVHTRNIVLAPASIAILKQLNIWVDLQSYVVPIQSIHVSQQHYFGSTYLQKSEPLGYAIELHDLSSVLQKKIANLQIMTAAQLIQLDLQQQIAIIKYNDIELIITAKLIIAADGAHSTVRKLAQLPVKLKSYDQHALIANIILNRPHDFHAYERFATKGPLAMIPMLGQRSSLIWCLPPHEAHTLKLLDDDKFLLNLQKVFGYRLGKLQQVSQRLVFPLQQLVMPIKIQWPLVFIGNAAQTLHPVAGQGFNLGLRDAATLAQCIIQHGINKNMLDIYQSMRQQDQEVITRFTDYLVRTFTSKIPGMSLIRMLGLLTMDNSKTLQKILAYYTCGYFGLLTSGIIIDKISNSILGKHVDSI